MRALDSWDRKIIALLQQDGRLANVEIARRLGKTEATVRKRIDRLVSSGVISIVAIADPERVGLAARMFIAIQTDQVQLEAIAQRLAGFAEVCSVDVVSGAYDVIIEVALPSSGVLLSFILDKVVTIPGVKRTDTYHVLRSAKRFCEWAIPDENPTGGGHPPPARIINNHIVPGAVVVPT